MRKPFKRVRLARKPQAGRRPVAAAGGPDRERRRKEKESLGVEGRQVKGRQPEQQGQDGRARALPASPLRGQVAVEKQRGKRAGQENTIPVQKRGVRRTPARAPTITDRGIERDVVLLVLPIEPVAEVGDGPVPAESQRASGGA